MADRRETHVWFDGETWSVYTERTHDRNRFVGWFGPPTTEGRDGETARWEGLPKDAVRVRRKARRPSKSPSESQVRARSAFRATRAAPTS